MIPALAAALPALLKVGGKVLDKVIPDPEAREKAKAEFAKQAAELDQKDLQSFRDFVIAYEGTGDQVHPVIQILRGSVRPILTYFLAGAFIWGFLHPGTYNADTTDLLWKLNLISLGFWYGERALKNLGMDLGRKK